MNISYKWLKNYINIDVSPEELSQVLTSIGLEVGTIETVQTVKGGMEGLVVGEVLTCEQHENADRLSVTSVDVGGDEALQIVCGAPNVAKGQKVIVATVGTTLYQGEDSFKIKRSKIRGVESFGMICAEDEIGLSEDHDGIIVLPENVEVGTLAKDYYKIEEDTIIEIDITPNRADATSHFGVARDLVAYYRLHQADVKLLKPSVDHFQIDNNNLPIPVVIEDIERCPRYSALTISGVQVKESPKWLSDYLNAIGLRPINNIVDITNFVLHELGHPLHAFDADKITTNEVRIKTLPQDTPFVTLDEVERKLHQDDLMICNGDEPMCIGGVFGGADSGVTENSTNIFLESAYFNPVSIRKSARRHGLNTDASFRFERGADPEITVYALKRAALLIQEIAGGSISSEIVDKYPRRIAPFAVELEKDKITRLVGEKIEDNVVKTILEGLEIEIVEETESNYKLLVPAYRVDVQRDVDVIEDILRIYGFNTVEIGENLVSTLSYSTKPNNHKLQRLISEQLTASGFNEILNNSLTKTSYYEQSESYPDAHSVKIMNPLSNDLGVMRQSILFGGMENIARNINHRNADLKFYEFGNVYRFDNENRKDGENLSPFSENYRLGLWVTGNSFSDSWLSGSKKSSIYELKAYVQNILIRLGYDLKKLRISSYENDIYAEALLIQSRDKKELASFGIVNDWVKKACDVEQDVYFADLNWDNIIATMNEKSVEFHELPKYPEVYRDLAFLLDKEIEFAQIEKLAYETERKLLKDVSLFDVYEGKNLEAGKKSYAISFTLLDESQTLTDKVIDAVMQKLQKRIEENLGASLRK